MSSIEKEEQPSSTPKPKRVMSEKQLENLRIGRERGVEKKRITKLEREGTITEEVLPPPPPPVVTQPIPEVVQEIDFKPKRVRPSRAKPKIVAPPSSPVEYEQQRMEANEQKYYYQQPPPQYNPYYYQQQYQPPPQPIPQPRRRGFR
jgi:hypothetical protein